MEQQRVILSGGTHRNEGEDDVSGESVGLNVERRVPNRTSKIFAAKAAIIASIGGLLFGYDIGVVAPALPHLEREMGLSLGMQDMVVATMLMGALAGALVAGVLTDRLGRWLTIILTDLAFIAGAAVLSTAQTPGVIYVGRFIVGVAVAVSGVADVSYLAEVAEPRLRGSMVSCNELAISMGMLASFVAGHFLRNMRGGWRFMFGIPACLAGAQLILMLWIMPRSPRWLLTQNRRAEAKAILLKIRNSQDDVETELVQIELSELQAQRSLRELLTKWTLPLVVTTALSFVQQLSAQSNVLNFNVAIFREAGFNAVSPAVVLGVVKVLSTVIAITWVDKVGRRPFLLWGAAGCTTSLWVLSMSFWGGHPFVSFLACCSLVASYSLSFGPVTWLVTAEMFPTGIRGKALGIGQIASFAGNLAVSAFFLRLLHVAGGIVTFFLFGSFVFISTAFIYALVPETKGKNPGQIASEIPSCGTCLFYEAMLDAETSADEAASPETACPRGSTEKWL